MNSQQINAIQELAAELSPEDTETLWKLFEKVHDLMVGNYRCTLAITWCKKQGSDS